MVTKPNKKYTQLKLNQVKNSQRNHWIILFKNMEIELEPLILLVLKICLLKEMFYVFLRIWLYAYKNRGL